jgi:hypothetical protein
MYRRIRYGWTIMSDRTGGRRKEAVVAYFKEILCISPEPRKLKELPVSLSRLEPVRPEYKSKHVH